MIKNKELFSFFFRIYILLHQIPDHYKLMATVW